MTDLPKWLSGLMWKARRGFTEQFTSRNGRMATGLIAAAEFEDRDVTDTVGLLIDHIEELRAFVKDRVCDCDRRDLYGNPYRQKCDRCRLLGEGGSK